MDTDWQIEVFYFSKEEARAALSIDEVVRNTEKELTKPDIQERL